MFFRRKNWEFPKIKYQTRRNRFLDLRENEGLRKGEGSLTLESFHSLALRERSEFINSSRQSMIIESELFCLQGIVPII